jgi:hypothetical protein
MNDMATALSAAVSGKELMAHCVEFAKRVKLSGTPEELESFHYLKKCLDGYGYRTKLILHDAYISLPRASSVEADRRTLKSITHSFSLNSPKGGLTADLVDVGEGTMADFAKLDCCGKIVLVDGIASPAAAANAKAAGAVGQLHVSPHEHLHEMCISPVWGSPSAEMLPEMPATVACTISDADGAALRAKLKSTGRLAVTLHAEVDTGWRKTPILVAHLDAHGAKDGPFTLLSGHHDTWYYGVMDNGSANATMLEAARLLAQHHKEWRRGLRVCFWSGHSHGRYSGSTWYVDNHFEDIDARCVAHVNVDSTGGIGATVLTDNGVTTPLVALAKDATKAEAQQDHAGKRASRSSDQSFWGVGIPSMYGSISHQPPGPVKMRNALGWWWHTPHDLLDKIDEKFLERDTRVVVHTLWRLQTDPVLPLDCAAHAGDLLAELRKLAEKLGDAVAIGGLVKAAEALEAEAKSVAARSGVNDQAKLDAINAALMHASRALVPLDYTDGDRFSHDPALPQSAWPALDPLRALSQAKPGSDQARFVAVGARRAANRVLHALKDAQAALGAALAS